MTTNIPETGSPATFYTVAETARLRVDPATIYRAIREDAFPTSVGTMANSSSSAASSS
jgi:hypothetical protein